RRKLPLVIETDRLPETRTMLPRLQVATARDGDGLEVMATIVYGDPAVARVDGDRLTLLVQGATAPVRNLGAEKALSRQLRDGLSLEPGVRAKLSAGEAVDFRR